MKAGLWCLALFLFATSAGSASAATSANSLVPWKALIDVHPDASRLDDERAQRQLPRASFSVQRIEAARGEHVNFDEFAVTVDRAPSSGPASAEDLLEYIRLHLDDFLDDDFARFEALDSANADAWHGASGAPLGALMLFRIPIVNASGSSVAYAVHEDAAVVVSVSDARSFVFSTVSVGPFGPGEHPVSGNRQFGVSAEPGQPMRIYVRGVDRVIDSSTSPNTVRRMTAGMADEAVVFRGADALWNSFQRNVKRYVDSHGGQARIEAPVVRRPAWQSREVADLLGTDLPSLRVAAQIQQAQDRRDELRQRAVLEEMIAWPRVLKRRAWEYLVNAVGLACAHPEKFQQRYGNEEFPGVEFSAPDFRDFYDADLARKDSAIDFTKPRLKAPNECQQSVLSMMQSADRPLTPAAVLAGVGNFRAAHPGLLARLAAAAAQAARTVDRFAGEVGTGLPRGDASQSSQEAPRESRGMSGVHNIDLSGPRWDGGPGSGLGEY